MHFNSIILKNLKYNFNKYISFYLVNSLIITILFMYGSLIFNDSIINQMKDRSLYETIALSLLGLIIFSIIFISYTNIALLKQRGKEFGMYLTLGMTTKDLLKLIVLENIGILIGSLGTGITTGLVFSRLFYMILNKILGTNIIVYSINFKSFVFSISIFVVIFLGNFIFNMFYIKKVEIVKIIKVKLYNNTKTSNVITGIILIFLLIITMYYLPKTLGKEVFENQSYMKFIFIAITIIAPYSIIGSTIGVLKKICSRFPTFYNSNLLILSNLEQKFVENKNMLYMLSVLVAGYMFFIGYSYCIYTSTGEYIQNVNPYDLIFVGTDKYNNTSKEEISKMAKKENIAIDEYKVLEYIEVQSFIEEDDYVIYKSSHQNIISESNYNKHMNEDLKINKDSAVDINVISENFEIDKNSYILSALSKNQIDKIISSIEDNDFKLSKDEFYKILDSTLYTNIDSKNIEVQSGVPFSNNVYTDEYYLGNALVINDEDYDLILKSLDIEKKNIHLINSKDSEKAFDILLDNLNFSESYRPIYKGELIQIELSNNGMILFTMMFIGILFAISNGVVLYYKVLNDIREDTSRLRALKSIGITQKEVEKLISKELVITFLVPIVVGGSIGTYYLYVMFSNSNMLDLLMNRVIVIWAVGALIQIVFYLISKQKYFKNIKID